MNVQQKVLYKVKGGIAIGKSRLFSWKASWPNAELVVYSDRVLLNLPWAKLNLLKEEIDEIRIVRIFLGWRIQIIHHNLDHHKYIGFLILKWEKGKFGELIDILKAAGYYVRT